MYEFEKKKLYEYLGESLVNQLKLSNAFIAGGTITSLFCNREINDIDIYFRTQDDLINMVSEVFEDNQWVIAHTDKATLLKYDNKIEIQLIHFGYFKDSCELFKTFDFTVCMGCFDFKTEEFIFHEDFLKHNSQRILKFNSGTAFPIVTALRVQKYEGKGYSISKPEFIRILLTCMNLKITTFKQLKSQMGGMYGINYEKLFLGMNEENFNLLEVIDKLKDLIFNDDYFNKPETVIEFDGIETLIDSITKREVKALVVNDDIYRIGNKNNLIPVNKLGEFTKVDAGEYFKHKKLYKFVKKDRDRYFSFYDESFEYKIGEIAVAREKGNSFYNRCNCSLYCGEFDEIQEFTYQNNKDAVLIELEINSSDFINKDSFFKVKKAKFIREVPKEEYQKQ